MTAQQMELRVASAEEAIVKAHCALCNAALGFGKSINKEAGRKNGEATGAVALAALLFVGLCVVVGMTDLPGGGWL